MSGTEVQMDDYTVTSQTADVAQVRASLAEPAPVPPPETPPAETPETPGTPETPETPETPPPADQPPPAEDGQPRDAKGQFAPGKKKVSLQERLDHTVWEREEARRETARLQAELETLRRSAAAPSSTPPGPAPSPAASSDKPDLADFDTHEEWADALVAWHMRQRDEAAAAWAAQQEQVALANAWKDREAAYAATQPTYREAMSKVATVKIPPVLQLAMLESEHGPALAFYLATHPEYATGLIGKHWKTPIEAAPLLRELLEMKLPSTPAPTGSGNGDRHVVPPPITPVGASPVVADPVPIDELPPDDYVEAANAREFAERKKRQTLRA